MSDFAGAKVALPSCCWWCEGGFTKPLSGEVFVGVKLAVSSKLLSGEVFVGAKLAVSSKPLSGEVWLGGRCIKDSVAQRSDFPAVERQNLP